MRVAIVGGIYNRSPDERNSITPTPEENLAVGLELHGFEVQRIGLNDFSEISSCQFDVMHVHHLAKGTLVAARRSGPKIFTYHANNFNLELKRRIAQRVVELRFQKLICLSQSEKDTRVAASKNLLVKMEVVPNGMSFESFKSIERKFNDQDEFKLLFVGQLLPVKRVHLILEALATLPEHVTLRMVYHNDTLFAELRALAERLQIATRVTFVGKLGPTELVVEYLNAHLLVLPSQTEALPSVVTEALATGLPVVAMRTGGISEQVGLAGVVEAIDNAGDLTNSIRLIGNSYPQFAKTAFTRSQQIPQEYSLQAMVDRHIAIYTRILDKGSS